MSDRPHWYVPDLTATKVVEHPVRKMKKPFWERPVRKMKTGFWDKLVDRIKQFGGK